LEARRSNITSVDFSAANDMATAGGGSMGGVSGGGEGEDVLVRSCCGLDGSMITVGVKDAGLSTSEYRFTLAGTGGGGDGASCRLTDSWSMGISCLEEEDEYSCRT
jgi:hypothetical protein